LLGCSVVSRSAADPQRPVAPTDGADERDIEVEQQSCERLDVGRLRSLFALEVRTVIGRLGRLNISVTCGPEETLLRVESPAWGRAERSMPARALRGAEAERLLALAGAQLVFATWLEVQPDGGARHENAAIPDAPAHAASVASPPAEPPPAAAEGWSSVEVGVEAGARARALGEVAVGPAASLLATAWRRRWGAELVLGVDRTVVARTLGTAELVAGELGLAAAWRSSHETPLALEVSAGPALAVLDLRGLSPAAHVSASSVTGVTMDARAAAALRYRRGGLWALARLEGGYLVSGPEGTITGDSSIAVRGPWAGANVGIGGAW
jgi:hypothetical protein